MPVVLRFFSPTGSQNQETACWTKSKATNDDNFIKNVFCLSTSKSFKKIILLYSWIKKLKFDIKKVEKHGGFMKKIHILLLSILLVGFSASAANKEEKPLWFIEEVFVKFGKKDAYENLEKNWMDSFKSFLGGSGLWRTKKHFWNIYALQALNESQYMFFVPMENFSDLGDFFSKKEEFNLNQNKDQVQIRQSLRSVTNFSATSLHSYLSNCSRVSQISIGAWDKFPYLYFLSYGITPGNENIFEDHLASLATDTKIELNGSIYRVWKVLVGSDLPKYLILISSQTEDQLKSAKDTLNFTTPAMKDIIRNHREGQAVYKPNL